MTIYVDPLLYYSEKPFGRNYWCHMTTDGQIEELHQFAGNIGLRQRWFQNHPRVPHYDLTSNKRNEAISRGAIVLSHEKFVQIRIGSVSEW